MRELDIPKLMSTLHRIDNKIMALEGRIKALEGYMEVMRKLEIKFPTCGVGEGDSEVKG